jgi:poly(3-hydroxybutyrate) depolymerase
MKILRLFRSFGPLCFVGILVASCRGTQGPVESKEQIFGLNFAGVPKKEISIQGRQANVYYKKRDNGKRPLLLFLHGFGNEPEQLARLFDMPYNFERENFVLLIPRGILGAVKDSNEKKLYWNATDDCCGLEKPNDDAYLVELVRRTISDPDLAIDSKEVYIFGYSNGAFMGYTLACNHADLFRGLIAYAGSSHGDANQCKPSQGVHILHVHGTNDRLIRFDSPNQKPPSSETLWFPPPAEIVARWANHNRCFSGKTSEKVSLMSLNIQPDPSFDASEPPLIRQHGLFNDDKETEVETYQNCEMGKVEFWKVSGGTHFNFFNRGTFRRAWKFIQSP